MNWQRTFAFLAILAILTSMLSAASQNVGGQNTISPAHVFPHPKMLMDSSNNVHVLWYQVFDSLENSGVYYSKISSNGRLLQNGKIIDIEESQGRDNHGFSIYIDPHDFIHVRYGDRYAKIDTDGKVVENIIPLTEKLLISGLSVFKYSDDGYASFSNREVIHSDGLIYRITDPSGKLKLTTYDLNGTVLLERNITIDISTNSFWLLMDNANNLHIFSGIYNFIDSATYHTKIDKNGTVLTNTTPILDHAVFYHTIIFHENEIVISCNDVYGLSSSHILRLDMDGTLLNKHTFAENCSYSTFAIDKDGNYCIVTELEFMKYNFLKLDPDYNTMVRPLAINKEPTEKAVLSGIIGIITILALVPILFFWRRRRMGKRGYEIEDKGSETHEK